MNPTHLGPGKGWARIIGKTADNSLHMKGAEISFFQINAATMLNEDFFLFGMDFCSSFFHITQMKSGNIIVLLLDGK